MIAKGRNRDTAWYAAIDADWPRMAGAFESWRRYDEARQQLMKAELKAIRDLPGISPNLFEVAGKMLG